MIFPLNAFYTSIGIRIAQFVLTIISLGLSGANVHEFDYDKINFVLAVSVLTLVYLVVVSIPRVLSLIPSMVFIIGEGIFWIFWLAAFASMADDFGNISCDGYYYYGSSSWWNDYCSRGKALIAMGVLNWLLFSASLLLLIIYSIIPLVKQNNKSFAKFGKDNFVLGGIFLQTTPLTKVEDPELEAEKTTDMANSTDQDPTSDHVGDHTINVTEPGEAVTPSNTIDPTVRS